MSFDKRAAGTGFQVLFEFESFVFVRDGKIKFETDRQTICGCGNIAIFVPFQSFF